MAWLLVPMVPRSRRCWLMGTLQRMGQHFLLDGGPSGWFVYVDTRHRRPPTAVAFSSAGDEIGWTTVNPAARRGWWVGPFAPEHVRLTGAPGSHVEAYRLADGVVPSELYPAALSTEEYRARVYRDDLDVIDERAHALYEAVRVETPPPQEILHVAELLVLEGEPEPDDALTWQAKLPLELQHRPEYLHLFPGEFAHDFQQTVHDAIERLADVEVAHCFLPRIHQRGQFIEVLVRVPFDPPQTTMRKPAARRKARAVERAVERKADVRLQITVPRRVAGENRAAAKATWDRLLADALAEVRAAAVKACGCCQGRGYVEASG